VVRPTFPAASPYITAVGGTELANGVTGGNSEPICKNGTIQCASGGYEIVASNKVLAFYSSGGGFSNVAPQPSWQATVVNKYLTNSSAVPPPADFNATGRGYPDVAALGHNFFVVLSGSVSSVDGTSAATPSFAGVVALINAQRLAAGKPVLGFANPTLYAAYAEDPLAFNDVVQGDNTCTEDACPCPAGTGYYAAPGWDATTGLGTPNYGRLLAAINSLDAKREAKYGKAKVATA
jgi:tripeptidyl-peptidase-1